MEGQIRRLSEKSEYEVRILDGGRCVDYCVMGDLAEAAEWAYAKFLELGADEVRISFTGAK